MRVYGKVRNGYMKKAALRRGKIAILLLVVLLLRDIPSIVYAKTTQEQLDEALKDRKELQDRMDEQGEQLDDLRNTESGLQKELKNLNEQLTEVSNRLTELEGQIADKEEEIRITQEELEAAKADEEWQYECVVKHIQYMYEAGESSYLELFFSVGSISDFLTYGDYFAAIADYDKRMMDAYETARILVEEQEARLQQEKAELDDLRVAAEAEKSKVAGLVSQTSGTISRYGDEIDKAEAEMRAYEEELRKKNDSIEALKKKIEEEKRLSQEAAKAAWRDISEVSFADGDRKLLANLIYCEAGGEPYAGKLAVGAVVINRVLSSKYADTVVGVIYQPYQFSPVRSGRLELALSVDRANADCYKAADEAMSGITNVGNCLYFRTPIEGLTGISIGGHIFY